MAFKIIDAHMHLGPRPARMVPDQRVSSLIDLMDHLGIERCISAHRLSMMGQYEEGIAAERAASEACGGRIYSFCIRQNTGDIGQITDHQAEAFPPVGTFCIIVTA